MTRFAAVRRLASDRVRTRLTTRTWFAIAPTLSVVLVACGSGRNYDNPPDISPITAGSSTSTTSASTTTVFVPTTAPTTLGPVTQPPTAPPPPPPPPTQPPTQPPTVPPPPTTPPPTTGETYAVVGGDTLFGISRRLGVTLDALLAANGLNSSSLITPGQRLQIPVGGSVPATNAPTNPPATNAPATNPPATNAPATNPPGTSPPATNPPGTTPPGTSPPTSPQNQPTTTFAAPPGAVQPSGASATCQAPDSQEANGTPIVFSPSNVLDRNPASAWRCAAPATGETLTVTLSGDTHLTSVGMIGGYDKIDPLTGIDRWPQNHRARQVRWTFSDGTTVTQDLADSRGMQSITVDVTTSSVTIEILSTYPASGEDPKQMVVVAEVQLIGG